MLKKWTTKHQQKEVIDIGSLKEKVKGLSFHKSTKTREAVSNGQCPKELSSRE